MYVIHTRREISAVKQLKGKFLYRNRKHTNTPGFNKFLYANQSSRTATSPGVTCHLSSRCASTVRSYSHIIDENAGILSLPRETWRLLRLREELAALAKVQRAERQSQPLKPPGP